MHAHKLKVTIPEDHRVELRLPDDFPEGPAEVIVLAGRSPRNESPAPGQNRALAALAELQTVPLTPEEEEVLDQFEAFQREHAMYRSRIGTKRLGSGRSGTDPAVRSPISTC